MFACAVDNAPWATEAQGFRRRAASASKPPVYQVPFLAATAFANWRSLQIVWVDWGVATDAPKYSCGIERPIQRGKLDIRRPRLRCSGAQWDRAGARNAQVWPILLATTDYLLVRKVAEPLRRWRAGPPSPAWLRATHAGRSQATEVRSVQGGRPAPSGRSCFRSSSARSRVAE